MRAHWAYFQYVMRHKRHVFVGCLRLGVPLHQAIIHDWVRSSCRSNGMRMCGSLQSRRHEAQARRVVNCVSFCLAAPPTPARTIGRRG